MKNAYVIISVVCAIVRCCPAETGQLQPVGYLRADVYVPEPLSLNTTSRLTTHVFNISNCPVQMHIGRFGFQPCFVVLGTPRTPTKECPRTDVWGPGIDTRMKTVENRVLVSGWDPDAYRPERYGIIVLKDEGYARKVTFLPGWLSKTELPDNCQSLKNLAVDAGVSYKVQTPLLTPEAVQSGKPILFGETNQVYAPSCRLVSFNASSYSQGAEKKQAVTNGLSLEIEIWDQVEVGKDIAAVYLIGNQGPHSVWVWQNALVQANTTFTVRRFDKQVISTISGDSLKAMTELLPTRPPIPLNPGEYLTFRRILPASALPIRRHQDCTLTLVLDAQYSPDRPGPEDKPQVMNLTTTTAIQVK